MKIFCISLLMIGAALGKAITEVSFPSPTTNEEVKNCKCGVMASKDANATAEMEHEIKVKQLNISCDKDGLEKCSRLCTVLAETAKVDKVKQNKFCASVGKDIKLTPSLFASVCNQNYSYSGVTFDSPVCCKDKLIVDC